MPESTSFSDLYTVSVPKHLRLMVTILAHLEQHTGLDFVNDIRCAYAFCSVLDNTLNTIFAKKLLSRVNDKLIVFMDENIRMYLFIVIPFHVSF